MLRMIRMVPITLGALAACAGCSFGYNSGNVAGSVATGSGGRIAVHTDNRVLAGVVVTLVMAEGVRYYLKGDDGTLTPLRDLPPPDPARRVSEQDCSKPIDLAAGNLRCR